MSRDADAPGGPTAGAGRAVVEVRVGAPQPLGPRVRHAAEVRLPAERTRVLWFEVDAAHADLVTPHGDPFVFAPLMLALAGGHDLVVDGATLDPLLVEHLAEFVRIWSAWFGYPEVRVTAETRAAVAPRPGTVVAFSGGVDAAFSAWRHTRGDAVVDRRVDAAMMLHGLDVPLSDPDGFARAAARARRMTDDLGIPLVTVATNAWTLPVATGHFTGLGVAAGLHLLAGGFGTGLVPATAAYRDLVVPLNSSPVSDWLLGGSDFAILHDGASADRFTKVATLAEWPEAMASVRVCLRHAGHDDNCGECTKCMMTLTALHVLGVAAPGFTDRPDADTIDRWARTLPRREYYLQEGAVLARAAQDRGIDERWVTSLERRIRRARVKAGMRAAAPRASARAADLHRRWAARRAAGGRRSG
jgi:hypothetical protein